MYTNNKSIIYTPRDKRIDSTLKESKKINLININLNKNIVLC